MSDLIITDFEMQRIVVLRAAPVAAIQTVTANEIQSPRHLYVCMYVCMYVCVDSLEYAVGRYLLESEAQKPASICVHAYIHNTMMHKYTCIHTQMHSYLSVYS